MTDDDLLTIIETDYRLRHMYWIEKRLNKRLEKWFRKTDEIDIDDLLAKKQINDLQIEVFAFYNKNCLLYTSPSPRDGLLSRMPSSA